jgi:hypothetical protein
MERQRDHRAAIDWFAVQYIHFGALWWSLIVHVDLTSALRHQPKMTMRGTAREDGRE